jgi:hypothetical protein
MMIKQLQSRTNYGAITDISKSLNLSLGDKSGRTVCLRTAHGFKSIFNCNYMHDDAAELIVHSGMVTAFRLINSKNKNEQGAGVLLSFALLLCYQEGKITYGY